MKVLKKSIQPPLSIHSIIWPVGPFKEDLKEVLMKNEKILQIHLTSKSKILEMKEASDDASASQRRYSIFTPHTFPRIEKEIKMR
jgi:hypothetical protein